MGGLPLCLGLLRDLAYSINQSVYLHASIKLLSPIVSFFFFLLLFEVLVSYSSVFFQNFQDDSSMMIIPHEF